MATESTNKRKILKLQLGTSKKENLFRLFLPLKLKHLMMRNHRKNCRLFLVNFGCTPHFPSALHRHRRVQCSSPWGGMNFFTPFSSLYITSAKKLRWSYALLIKAVKIWNISFWPCAKCAAQNPSFFVTFWQQRSLGLDSIMCWLWKWSNLF